MRRSLTLIGVLFGCLLLSGIPVGMSQAKTASVPQFLGDSAFLQSTPDANPDATNDIEERWRFVTGAQITSPPLVVEGAVYITSSDGNLYVLDAATGMEWWRFKTGGRIASPPAVVAGVVYVWSFDGYVYALDARTGTERWRFEAKASSPPVVVAGVVYVAGWDHNVYSLAAATGAERWRFTTGDDIVSSPVVVDDVVYVGSADGNVYALNADLGTERWRFTTGDAILSSPVVVDDVVYVGSADGNVYALNADLGTERWRFMVGSFSYPPLVVDRVVYVGRDDDNVVALDAAMGTERWRFTTGDAMLSSPVVVDDVVYVGGNDGDVYALNAATGTEQWRFTTWRRITASPVVADGVVYFGSGDGNVYALDAATGIEQWRSRIKSWAESMTVVDDVVYIGSLDGNVYALGARPLVLEAGGQAVVTRDGTVLRGAPAVSGVERATLAQGTAVTLTGDAVYTGNLAWWPVTVDETGELGWIAADDLEPTANPPSATPSALQEGEIPRDADSDEVSDEVAVIQPIDGTVIDAEENDGDRGDDNSGGDTGDDDSEDGDSGNGDRTGDNRDDDQIEPVGEIEATEDSEDASADGDTPANTEQTGQGGDAGDAASGTGQDLGTAPEVGDLASIPGDPGGRLHIDQSGQLSFSGTPGSVTFERDGLALEQREVDTGASVFVCDDSGNCIDATSASADGFHTDYPLGWLGSKFLYERVGEDGEVSFRAVQLAEGSLEVIEDRLIASGGSGLETLTRSYPVEGGLLVPAPDAWLLISTEGVRQIDGNPYGADISRIRTAPAANTIAYVAQGQIVIASLSSPGTPEAVIPFTGNEYALAPDGSRVAVTDGSTIQILDRTGRVVESFANEAGIAIGSIAWGNDGIVFIDQSNGVLRKIDPAGQ